MRLIVILGITYFRKIYKSNLKITKFINQRIIYSSKFTKTFSDLYFSFFFVFLGLHLWHMEVPRLEADSEL